MLLIDAAAFYQGHRFGSSSACKIFVRRNKKMNSTG
jgi:hypothetical protein